MGGSKREGAISWGKHLQEGMRKKVSKSWENGDTLYINLPPRQKQIAATIQARQVQPKHSTHPVFPLHRTETIKRRHRRSTAHETEGNQGRKDIRENNAKRHNILLCRACGLSCEDWVEDF